MYLTQDRPDGQDERPGARIESRISQTGHGWHGEKRGRIDGSAPKNNGAGMKAGARCHVLPWETVSDPGSPLSRG